MSLSFSAIDKNYNPSIITGGFSVCLSVCLSLCVQKLNKICHFVCQFYLMLFVCLSQVLFLVNCSVSCPPVSFVLAFLFIFCMIDEMSVWLSNCYKYAISFCLMSCLFEDFSACLAIIFFSICYATLARIRIHTKCTGFFTLIC